VRVCGGEVKIRRMSLLYSTVLLWWVVVSCVGVDEDFVCCGEWVRV
jgi:hypothetical protein